MQHGFPERVSSVYLFGEALKLYASGAEVVEDVHEVAHTSPQAVELPDYQRIAALQLLEAAQ